MTQPSEIAATYVALWNDDDAASRDARLADGWADDARYADPIMSGHGRDGIANMIAGARQQFPGHTFRLKGGADGHGRFVRFSWTLASLDGVSVGGGTDVVRLDEDGRIDEVIGFLDGGAA